MTFKLVSCDGGGIRGYLTCLILQGLHEETGFLDSANGFAGTSTGGLISVVLADGRTRGKNMSDLVKELISLYHDKAEQIFLENERSLFDKALDEVLKRFHLTGGPGVTAAQFSSAGLEKIGYELVGDRTIGSISKDIILAVTTVCLHLNDKVGWAPFTMTNQMVTEGPWIDMSDIKLLDVAMATSAAPTYFPPHRIESSGRDYGYFADGGMFANNPVLNGINIAVATQKGVHLDNIQVASVGTGRQPTAIAEDTFKTPEDWGLLKWFGVTSDVPTGALLELGLSTSAENQFWIAHLVLKDQLARLDPPLSKTVGLAKIEPRSFTLMDEAYEIARNSKEWTRTVEMLHTW